MDFSGIEFSVKVNDYNKIEEQSQININVLEISKRIGFDNNLTIKHWDKTKVETFTVKNSKDVETLKSDDVSTFILRHF